MDNWLVLVGLFAVAYACLKCAEHLRRIADCQERMERLRRDQDAITNSIGGDIVVALRDLPYRKPTP